jgi:hypothetical protein
MNRDRSGLLPIQFFLIKNEQCTAKYNCRNQPRKPIKVCSRTSGFKLQLFVRFLLFSHLALQLITPVY